MPVCWRWGGISINICLSIAETPVQEVPNSRTAAVRLSLASHEPKFFFYLIHTKWQALVNISIEKERPQTESASDLFLKDNFSLLTLIRLVLSLPWKLLLNKFSALPYASSPKQYCLVSFFLASQNKLVLWMV